MALQLILVLKLGDEEVGRKSFAAGSGAHLYVGSHVCPEGFRITVGVPGEVQLFTHRQYGSRTPDASPWNLLKLPGTEVSFRGARQVEWHRASGAQGEWCTLHVNDAGTIKFPDRHVIEFHHES